MHSLSPDTRWRQSKISAKYLYLFEEHHGAAFHLILLENLWSGCDSKLCVRHVHSNFLKHLSSFTIQTLQERARAWTSTHRWLHDLMLALDRRTDLEESHYSDVMGVYELSCRVCRLQGFSTGASATLHPLGYPCRRPLTCREKVDIKRLFQVLWSKESPTSAYSSALSRNDNKRVETASQWIQLRNS